MRVFKLTLSNSLAEVLGIGHSTSCFTQRSSSNLLTSLEDNCVGHGSFTDRTSSKAGNIDILLKGGVKSISTAVVVLSTPSG